MSKARLWALALVSLLVIGRSSVASAAETTILVLAGGLGPDEERLVEALRIYTGDVEGRLVLVGQAPDALAPRVVEQLSATARREHADIVVWGARRADRSPVYYVLDVAERDLRETEIEPLGAERASVAVALKVRALLFRNRAHADAAAPADEAARTPAPAPPPRPPLIASPAPPPVAPVPVAIAVVASPRAAVFHRLAISAGYALAVPTDPTWLRQALLVSVEGRVGAPAADGVALFVDAAFARRADATVRGLAVTFADQPFGVGGLLIRQAGALGLAVGPRASLHVIDVEAGDDDGRSGSAKRLAFGLGGLARADLALATYMKVYLGASLEALVPKQEFRFVGQPVVDSGRVLLGVSAGLRWLIL